MVSFQKCYQFSLWCLSIFLMMQNRGFSLWFRGLKNTFFFEFFLSIFNHFILGFFDYKPVQTYNTSPVKQYDMPSKMGQEIYTWLNESRVLDLIKFFYILCIYLFIHSLLFSLRSSFPYFLCIYKFIVYNVYKRI